MATVTAIWAYSKYILSKIAYLAREINMAPKTYQNTNYMNIIWNTYNHISIPNESVRKLENPGMIIVITFLQFLFWRCFIILNYVCRITIHAYQIIIMVQHDAVYDHGTHEILHKLERDIKHIKLYLLLVIYTKDNILQRSGSNAPLIG